MSKMTTAELEAYEAEIQAEIRAEQDSAEPLKPGATFWHIDGRPRVHVEVEMGEVVGSVQRYRYRPQDGRWSPGQMEPAVLLRLYNKRVEPPEPIKYTLATLVRGVMEGRVCTEGLKVSIDNDSMYAERKTGEVDQWGDPEFVEVWHGNGPRCELEDLLNDLGLPAGGV